jgi:ABC-type multidrug transport system ATPase subunit
MYSVEVQHISKSYTVKKQATVALKDISFAVTKGELFGIIGPDGAGKTSLFRILTTLLLADNGTATIAGLDMPGRFSLYQDLTVKENLDFFATIFNTSVEENYDLIKDIYSQIEPFADRKAGKLSGGMKQKLALSCALIHRPSVLFLDEPTTGVDAVSRKEFWEMLKRLKAQGITILVSTPYMDEAELCDRVALIQGGSILSIDTPAQIVAAFEPTMLAVRAKEMLHLLNHLKESELVANAYPSGIYHHVIMKEGADAQLLQQQLATKTYTGLEIVKGKPTIEDCFMQLMRN